jgi:hypothetical protein
VGAGNVTDEATVLSTVTAGSITALRIEVKVTALAPGVCVTVGAAVGAGDGVTVGAGRGVTVADTSVGIAEGLGAAEIRLPLRVVKPRLNKITPMATRIANVSCLSRFMTCLEPFASGPRREMFTA